jgi:hypothetical protein
MTEIPEPPFQDEDATTVLTWIGIGAGSLVLVALLSDALDSDRLERFARDFLTHEIRKRL